MGILTTLSYLEIISSFCVDTDWQSGMQCTVLQGHSHIRQQCYRDFLSLQEPELLRSGYECSGG